MPKKSNGLRQIKKETVIEPLLLPDFEDLLKLGQEATIHKHAYHFGVKETPPLCKIAFEVIRETAAKLGWNCPLIELAIIEHERKLTSDKQCFISLVSYDGPEKMMVFKAYQEAMDFMGFDTESTQDPIVPSGKTYDKELVAIPPSSKSQGLVDALRTSKTPELLVRRYEYSQSPGTNPAAQQVKIFRDKLLTVIHNAKLGKISHALGSKHFIAVPFSRSTPGGVLLGFFRKQNGRIVREHDIILLGRSLSLLLHRAASSYAISKFQASAGMTALIENWGHGVVGSFPRDWDTLLSDVKKMPSGNLASRLERFLSNLHIPHGFGCAIRTIGNVLIHGKLHELQRDWMQPFAKFSFDNIAVERYRRSLRHLFSVVAFSVDKQVSITEGKPGDVRTLTTKSSSSVLDLNELEFPPLKNGRENVQPTMTVFVVVAEPVRNAFKYVAKSAMPVNRKTVYWDIFPSDKGMSITVRIWNEVSAADVKTPSSGVKIANEIAEWIGLGKVTASSSPSQFLIDGNECWFRSVNICLHPQKIGINTVLPGVSR